MYLKKILINSAYICCIIIFLSGCKANETEKYKEILTKTSEINQGGIVTNSTISIKFDESGFSEKDYQNVSQYKQIDIKSILKFDKEDNYENELSIVFGGTGLRSVIYKNDKNIWITPPILNGFINISKADFLNNLLPELNIQANMIRICSLSSDTILYEWLTLIEDSPVKISKKSILMSAGEKKVKLYTQTLSQQSLLNRINSYIKNLDLNDMNIIINELYFDFDIDAQVNTYVNKNNEIIKQEFAIEGKSKNTNEEGKDKSLSFMSANQKWNLYPIQSFQVIVDIDFSEFGQLEDIKMPIITEENTINEEMLIRVLENIAP